MSKNLLNEAQVLKFMKLAKLGPLSPGFVKGLTETTASDEELEEVRTGIDPSPNLQSARRGRGRGREGADRLEEVGEEEELGVEDPEVDDLPVDDAAAEEVVDDVEAVEPEVGAEGAPTEEEVLAALQIIARAAGVEGLEMDVESTGEPSAEEPALEEPGLEEPGLEEPGLEGEEAEFGAEEEEALEEGGPADWAKIAGGGKVGGSLKPDPAKGEKDYTPTPEEIEAARKRPIGRTRVPSGGSDDDTKKPAGSAGMRFEGRHATNTNELVEQITKRVAARILKAALQKK
tara:strand:- start:1018 stop:1884 length:867 start_codon:yes stop_codon:yes gene_type:complete